jgi:hypothetical protein
MSLPTGLAARLRSTAAGEWLVFDEPGDLEAEVLTRRIAAPVVALVQGLEMLCNNGIAAVLKHLRRGDWQQLVIATTPGANNAKRARARAHGGIACDIAALTGAAYFRASTELYREDGRTFLIYQRYLTNMHSNQPMEGVVAATRTSADPGQLAAWLDYYLRFCETAAVVIHVRPHQTPDAVLAVLARYGERVVHSVFKSVFFKHDATVAELRDLVRNRTKGDCVIHLDRDEFIDDEARVREVVARLRADQCDHARGWMACRLAPGGNLYDSHLPTREAFLEAAPVRTCVLKEYRANHFKVWLSRWPQLQVHSPERAGREDSSMIAIDHFRWTHDLYLIAEGKAFNHMVKHRNTNSSHWAAMEADAIEGNPEFRQAAKNHFSPLSARLQGWFDYADVYRHIAEKMPDGGKFVEVGVWCGKSLGYLAEYAQLLAKRLELVGYDQFDPAYRLGTPEQGLTSDEWLAQVQRSMREVAPWHPPQVVRGDSAASAALHADGSLDAVWIDAGHRKEDVLADVRAWRPKIKPGGILAGHDLGSGHPGVKAALDELQVPYRAISRSSWISTT